MKKKILLILAGVLLTIGLSAQVAKLTYTRSTNSLNIGGVGAAGVNSTILLNGSTSGTTTIKPYAIAGSTTLTLPAETDTLITKSGAVVVVEGYIAAATEGLLASDSARTVGGAAYSYASGHQFIRGINEVRSTGTITDGTGITAVMLSRYILYTEAAATDISSDPQIVDGTDDQVITIIGSSDSNTLTLDDGAGLQLSAQCVLGAYDNITLIYIESLDTWIELSRTNN